MPAVVTGVTVRVEMGILTQEQALEMREVGNADT